MNFIPDDACQDWGLGGSCVLPLPFSLPILFLCSACLLCAPSVCCLSLLFFLLFPIVCGWLPLFPPSPHPSFCPLGGLCVCVTPSDKQVLTIQISVPPVHMQGANLNFCHGMRLTREPPSLFCHVNCCWTCLAEHYDV